jgi:hypothetical protein
MSLTASILIFLVGAVLSGFLFRLLRQRISEALANGLSFMVLSLALYPLAFWITGSREQSITIWIIACAVGAIATTGIYSIRRQR